jgi:predicted permease
MPLGMSNSDTSFEAVGYTAAPGEEMSADYNPVASRYLETMGIQLIEGRDIAAGDVTDAQDVVVINETLARRYFAGRKALGGQLKLFGTTRDIVGIAGDGKYTSINEAPRAALYMPVQQVYVPDATLVLKTTGDPLLVLPAVQAAVRELDPNVPLFEVRTMAEHLEFATFVQRTAASVVTGLGVVALLLAAIGLYGVIAGSVAQRMPEIGMRVALGARRRDIVGMVLRQGARIAVLGLAIGLVLAVAATRLLSGLLVGVSPTDAASYLLTIGVLAAVALAAAALPARRAARMDPLTALRHQ